MSKRVRSLLATLSAAVVVLCVATPAEAHIEVVPSSTAPGSAARLTFVVPTESTTASTTGITIELPTATPFSSVRAQAVPGWTAQITTTTLDTPVKDDDADRVHVRELLGERPRYRFLDRDADPGREPHPAVHGGLHLSSRLTCPRRRRSSPGEEIPWPGTSPCWSRSAAPRRSG